MQVGLQPFLRVMEVVGTWGLPVYRRQLLTECSARIRELGIWRPEYNALALSALDGRGK